MDVYVTNTETGIEMYKRNLMTALPAVGKKANAEKK
jgi:hypothetical protein